jgi:ectoine hydroxylase-related dioxygenase (phytanoyl-CoA dioxygenase family)
VPREGFPNHIKIAFYPEPLTRETGCLRVVPGSHNVSTPDLLAVLRDRNYEADFMPFGLAPSDVPSFAIESQPGDVVVFTENLLHGTFGGRDGRHQHALSFMANPKTDAEVSSVRTLYEGAKFGLHPAESYVASDRPRIRRMVSKLVELEFERSKA